MGTSPSTGLATEAKKVFSFHIIAALAALGFLGGGAFFASGYSRGAILAGIVCAAIAYLSK